MADSAQTPQTDNESQTDANHTSIAAMAEINSDLERARDLLVENRRDEALSLCREVLSRQNLPLRSAATLSLLMRRLGEVTVADRIRDHILGWVRSEKDDRGDSIGFLLPTAEALVDLEALDLAEEFTRRALEIAPDDMNVVVSGIAFLIQTHRVAEARDLALAFSARNQDDFDLLLYLSVIFARLEATECVGIFLAKAEEQCTTKAQRAKLNYQLAANGAKVGSLDQHGMAVALFDGFAESYDEKLTMLGNMGPSMIYSALEELRLPRTQTRAVLDAGCGTGLCAGFLREYAKTITGVDLSVKMLEKAREKRLYDTLARTDLSIAHTFPEGRFDLIVCADVLVYFGALNTVFENFRQALVPGGWLVFTVEDEMDPTVKTGFKLYSSGRYRHSDDYLIDTLHRCGFPKPKLLEHGRIRNELANPVLGTVVAVQKSALRLG